MLAVPGLPPCWTARHTAEQRGITMTALEALKQELIRIQQGMDSCITEHGVIKNECRHRYQLLVREATHIKGSIDWMKALYDNS